MVEHDFFGTANWQNLFFVSHGGYMVTQTVSHNAFKCIVLQHCNSI